MTLDMTNIGRRMSNYHYRLHLGLAINPSSNFTLNAVEVESQPVLRTSRRYCIAFGLSFAPRVRLPVKFPLSARGFRREKKLRPRTPGFPPVVRSLGASEHSKPALPAYLQVLVEPSLQ